jgi:hypothetical protein
MAKLFLGKDEPERRLRVVLGSPAGRTVHRGNVGRISLLIADNAIVSTAQSPT